MVFVGGGEEALEKITSEFPDIVVTDMRMPVIDGLELLLKTMEKRPDVVRYVLSGQARKEAILGIVNTAHQFFSKPCSAEVLEAKLTGTFLAMEIVQDDYLMARIAGPEPMAAAHGKLSGIVSEMKKDDPDTGIISEIACSDISIAACLFKLTGSGFFGDLSGERDIGRIVDILTVETLEKLINEYRILSSFGENSWKDSAVTEISLHSSRVSQLAGRITEEEGGDNEMIRDSEIAGLLHDIGRNIFLSYEDSLSGISDCFADEFSERYLRFESDVPSSTHAEAGAVLGTLWGYPSSIVRAIRYHHSPSDAGSTDFDCLSAVHAAEAIIGGIESGSENMFDHEYISQLGLENRIDDWKILSGVEVGV
jgi:CheY-like chemotaxis protein